jgi:hypothetical protein
METTSLSRSLNLIEVKPGLKFSEQVLKDLLPDAETVLFFGKIYSLDYRQVSHLLKVCVKSDLADVLFKGDHSMDLQDYLVDLYATMPQVTKGEITFDPDVPKGEILPELWKAMEIEVAASIQAVAKKLESLVGIMPGKQGKMIFQSMMVMNAKRPTIGDHRAKIHHGRVKENLLILDVSGSMTEPTIRAMVDDVVALSYMANAHLAIVSNSTTHWEPGGYGTDNVLEVAEYGGTHYETLEPLLQRDWGVVITVADYDSSRSAKDFIRYNAKGHIDTVVDVSLVNRPTFLAECVGQIADEVRPVLVAQHDLTGGY